MRRSLRFAVCLLSLGCGHEAAPPVAAPAAEPAPPPELAPEAAPVAREETPPPAEAVATPGPRRIEVTPAEVLSVGKWPEGLVVSDDALWVAESGARRVTRFGRSEKASTHASQTGRLPVDVVRDAGGNVYALVMTDHKVVAIDPGSGKVKTVAKTSDYPQALAEARGVLYVLLWEGNSSVNATLLRVEAKTGQQRGSGFLGKNALDIAVGHGRVWVARSEALTVLDEASLQGAGELALDEQPAQVLAADQGVYVGTAQGVLRVDPEKLEVTQRAALGQRVSAMTMYGDVLAAIGENGTITLLDPTTLAARAELVPEPFKPQAMVAHGEALFVSTHRGDGPGAVLVFRPSAEKPWK
jgi:hypothetical protein